MRTIIITLFLLLFAAGGIEECCGENNTTDDETGTLTTTETSSTTTGKVPITVTSTTRKPSRKHAPEGFNIFFPIFFNGPPPQVYLRNDNGNMKNKTGVSIANSYNSRGGSAIAIALN